MSEWTRIKPQKQKYKHDPENGIFGDCYRTCIAMMIGIDRDEVPHFLHDDCGAEEFNRRAKDWLGERGFLVITLPYLAENGVETILSSLNVVNPKTPFILTGESKTGVNHAVVCQGGEIVADPSLTNAGIVGPSKPSNLYWVEFIVMPPNREKNSNEKS